MAEVSAHLITGHSGTNHITSFNDRQRNRAIFGKGNYRLCGRETATYDYPYATRRTSSGNYIAKITKGNIMWNGLLVEIAEDIEDTTAYESLNNMNVYLHYERNTSNQTETVKLEFTFDTKTTTANTSFDDSKTDVRVLFGKYTSADGTAFTYGSGNSGENDFNIVKSATALINDEATARATAVTNEATARENADTTINNTLPKKVNYIPFMNGADNSTTGRELIGSFTVSKATSETDTSTASQQFSGKNFNDYAFLELRAGGNSETNSLGIFPRFMFEGNSNSAFGNGTTKNFNWRSLRSSGNIDDWFVGFYISANDTLTFSRMFLYRKDGTFNPYQENKTFWLYGIKGVS